MTTERDAQVVVNVGAEGGSLTLYRLIAPDGAEEFFTELNQVAMPEIEELALDPISRSHRVATLEAGMALLDRSPGWERLHPIEIDPVLAPRILAAVAERLRRLELDEATVTRALTRWRNAAGQRGR